jgi:hypothetical protein
MDVYAFRNGPKLELPKSVADAIASFRRTAMPFKSFYRSRVKPQTDNWRKQALVDCIRKVREREDPEYSELFAIFNKIAKANLAKLTTDAVALIKARDAEFRLRASTLLFDKAITNHAFASVMADCALQMSKEIPEIVDDLGAQVSLFDTLYNMTETIAYSDQNVVAWTSQKEKRKGYAKFVTELNVRSLVSDESVQRGIEDVLSELKTLLQHVKTAQTEENIHQCVMFLYETLKIIPTSNPCRTFMKTAIQEILASKPPTLGMKTRFKMEDALKV